MKKAISTGKKVLEVQVPIFYKASKQPAMVVLFWLELPTLLMKTIPKLPETIKKKPVAVATINPTRKGRLEDRKIYPVSGLPLLTCGLFECRLE